MSYLISPSLRNLHHVVIYQFLLCVEHIQANEFSEEEYSRTKVKCNEILTSPCQPKLTLFQQQIHSLPLQTNQQDQHTFLGQTFLGNIS